MLDLHSDQEKSLEHDEISEEILEHEENTSIWKSYIATLLRLAVLIIIFAVIIWYMLDNLYHTPDNSNEISIVKSDNSPIKIKPEDPGGMVVPNMDKDIYNNLSINNNDKTVERILPSPEEPVKREDIVTEDQKEPIAQEQPQESSNDLSSPKNISKENKSSDIEPANSNKNNIPQDNSTTKTQEPTTAQDLDLKNNESILHSESFEKNANNSVKQISNQPDSAKAVTQPEKIENSSTDLIKPLAVKKDKLNHSNVKATNEVTGYKIQLAAFKSQKEVSSEWSKIKVRYASILGKYHHLVEKKNLGDKGIFYRLQVGPFQNEAEARMICQKLNNHKQNCFVVKPSIK